MNNKLLITLAVFGINVPIFAQSIETPANTALTIASDVTLPSGKGLQSNGAAYLRLPTPATNNVQIGFGAGIGGALNAFIGGQAGANTTGNANVFIGSQAGFSNVGGASNLFLGQQAGYDNVGGSFNLFMGNSAGQKTNGSASTGSGNVFLGDGAGYGNIGGSNNTYIGRYSGFTGNASGSQNVFIGYGAGASTGATLTNAVAIGTNAKAGANNVVALGGTAGDAVSVGIGTATPSTKLEIVSGVANSAGLRLSNLTNASPATVLGATKFLSVDASGNVVLASLNASPRVATSSDAVTTSESYWQLAGGRLSNSSGEAVVIGKGISKLGGNYGLYVEKGILTEKVKVAIKNTSEWSDFVFAPAYKLRKLSEVESFIKAHGHLPGVPSAEQVVSEGVDMAKMDATLLQKIEELTLYMVDMKKEVNTLRNENVKLRQKNTTIERQIKQIRKSSK